LFDEPKPQIYGVGVGLALVWAFAFFWYTKIAAVIVLAVVLGLIVHASMWGPQSSFITEQFPTRLRYTGASISYTFAGFVAGATPAVLVALLREYHETWAPSAYVAFLLILTGIAVLAAGKTREIAEASLAFVACALMIFALPETIGKPLES
jgi:MFS family permease